MISTFLDYGLGRSRLVSADGDLTGFVDLRMDIYADGLKRLDLSTSISTLVKIIHYEKLFPYFNVNNVPL